MRAAIFSPTCRVSCAFQQYARPSRATLCTSRRGELEITDLNTAYLQRGQLHVEVMGRGFAWLDTGEPHNSLMQARQYLAIVKQRQGLRLTCPEAAFRPAVYFCRSKKPCNHETRD